MFDILGITRSKLRRKLLTYFFTNPHANLYLREVSSMLQEDPGNLSKEFINLEKRKIFISQTRGNQKYFCLNKKHPLYKELRSIIFKTTGIEGSLKEIMQKIKGITLSFIYGSFAQHKANDASDIDILIVGNPNEDELMEKIEGLEKKLQREINYTIYPLKEFKRKIKDKNSFILNILKRPRIILRGSLDEI